MKTKILSNTILTLLFAAVLYLSGCHRSRIISDDSTLKLGFSADTVTFDTVFTNIGSTTRQLIVYNQNDERLNISSIRIKGDDSPFTMNVDGFSGNELHDIEIDANDSIFVFVRLTINPLDQDNPYVVEDEIEFVTNGNEQSIKLLAFGQDVNYIIADRYIPGYPKFKIVADSLQTTTWTSQRPYVIIGYALVDSYGTLKIEEGTKIYIHRGGGIWAFSEGQLLIEGTHDNPVVIQGDRLEKYYENIAGQWDRIWLMENRVGYPHKIENAIIRNGFIGIQAESFLKAATQAVTIKNSIIENHSGIGIYTVMYDLDVENFVIDNCAQYGIALTFGGSHRLVHGTIANYWSTARRTPSLFFNNFAKDSQNNMFFNAFDAEIGNCIIYGNADNEFSTSMFGDADSTYIFKNCLLRTRIDTTSTIFSNCIFNENPLFTDYNNHDLHLDTIISPAIAKGLTQYAIEVPNDLDMVARPQNPDIGAYQFVENTEN